MQITVNSQALAAELRLLCKVTPSKPAIQTLGHILLSAEGNELKLYATDLEIGLATQCAAEVHEPGRASLPAAHFLALVEQFPDADVALSCVASIVNVKCGAFKSKLQAFEADDFPAQPTPDASLGTSTFEAEAFQRMIARTRYAINAGNAKAILQGALLTLAGKAAALAATDGKRLAVATTHNEGADARVIIPAKTLDMLAAAPVDGDVELMVGMRHLFFKLGERTLISRVFDGKFPKYEHIIPRDNDKIATLNRTALAAALKRVRLVSPESKAMYFSLTNGDANGNGMLHLASSSAEIGSADEEVAVTYDGPPLKVCANGNYALDFLEAAAGSTITLALKDAKSPMLLMDGADHLGVIMLMRS